MPQWMLELAPSDYLLTAFFLGQLWFIVDYGFFSPWWKHPIGYVVLTYGVSIVILMSLITYGVVAGQRVDEWLRTIAGVLLLLGIAGKIVVLHVSRHEGRIERRKRRHETGGM